MTIAERFANYIAETDEEDIRPVMHYNGITFVYVKYNNLYLMACTKRNSNATVIVLFLYRLVHVFKSYFKELEEESIRDNFVIIYELLDEMMDFGYLKIIERSGYQALPWVRYITQNGTYELRMG